MIKREKIKEHWWMTLSERQRKFRESQGIIPKQECQEKKKRKPYRWGAKRYLTAFNVGETKTMDDDFCWNSLRSIACSLKRLYGADYSFSKSGGVKRITRLQ